MPSDLKIVSDIYDIRAELEFKHDKKNGNSFIAGRHGVTLRVIGDSGGTVGLTLFHPPFETPYAIVGQPAKSSSIFAKLLRKMPRPQEPLEQMEAQLHRKLGELLAYAEEQCRSKAAAKPEGKIKLRDALYQKFMYDDS